MLRETHCKTLTRGGTALAMPAPGSPAPLAPLPVNMLDLGPSPAPLGV